MHDERMAWSSPYIIRAHIGWFCISRVEEMWCEISGEIGTTNFNECINLFILEINYEFGTSSGQSNCMHIAQSTVHIGVHFMTVCIYSIVCISYVVCANRVEWKEKYEIVIFARSIAANVAMYGVGVGISYAFCTTANSEHNSRQNANTFLDWSYTC